MFVPLSRTASPFHVVTVRFTPPTWIRWSTALTTIVLLPLPPVSSAVEKMPWMFSTVAPEAHRSP